MIFKTQSEFLDVISNWNFVTNPLAKITNNIDEIRKFYKQNKSMIMKPINGYGGNQIHLIKNKFNKKLITKFLNKNGHSMFQKFLINISTIS